MDIKGRSLHWVLKIADRTSTISFLRNVVGLKVLRHEEFTEGCEAMCNGKYDGRWSKTMLGFGPEDNHFAIELTYNYGIKKYELGNDFLGFSINSKKAFENAKSMKHKDEGKELRTVESPDGYIFKLFDLPVEEGKDLFQSISLQVKNLEKSLEFWKGTLGLKVLSQTEKENSKSAILTFDESQVPLELIENPSVKEINHAEAYGRIAFSCPTDQLPLIEKTIKEKEYVILTPRTTLPTPGKADVDVIILADPDGYEICFVGDEGYRELSQVDEKATELLDKAIEEDDSVEYLEKRKKMRGE